jgi:hypothetical protein
MRPAPLVFALALAAASLSLSGCGGKGCGLNCGDPAAYVEVPNLMQMEIQRVDADLPCKAQVARVGNDGHEAAYVYRNDNNPGTCRIIIHLANQDTYVATVEFASRACACGGTILYEQDASVPELVLGHDAGTD